jgi:hypothetical protein
VGTALVALLALRRGPQPWLDELPRDYAPGPMRTMLAAMIFPIPFEHCTELHHVAPCLFWEQI